MAPTQQQGSSMKIALIQMAIGSDKQRNLDSAARKVAEAKKNGAFLVVLPECFNAPYEISSFEKNAEQIPDGPSSLAMSKMAKDNGVYLVGGSMSEKAAGKYYNACPVFGPNGKLISLQRKVHLFNMDIPGKCTFFESKVFSPGEGVNVFDVGNFKVGVAICYDLRFPEWAGMFRDQGVNLMLYPGAFDTYTGPLHWGLLLRARALDNQMYTAGVCGARDTTASYVDYGHSMLVDPWGRILVEADEKETILYHTIDMKVVDEVRKQIPVNDQRRLELYNSKKV